jgi:hypothetical protein
MRGLEREAGDDIQVPSEELFSCKSVMIVMTSLFRFWNNSILLHAGMGVGGGAVVISQFWIKSNYRAGKT